MLHQPWGKRAASFGRAVLCLPKALGQHRHLSASLIPVWRGGRAGFRQVARSSFMVLPRGGVRGRQQTLSIVSGLGRAEMGLFFWQTPGYFSGRLLVIFLAGSMVWISGISFSLLHFWVQEGKTGSRGNSVAFNSIRILVLLIINQSGQGWDRRKRVSCKALRAR